VAGRRMNVLESVHVAIAATFGIMGKLRFFSPLVKHVSFPSRYDHHGSISLGLVILHF